MKKLLSILSVLIITTSIFAQDITVTIDNDSSYTPTRIINGDFHEAPWMGFIWKEQTYRVSDFPISIPGGTQVTPVPNGTDEGWNTTDYQIEIGNGLITNLMSNVGSGKQYAGGWVVNSYLQTSNTEWAFIDLNPAHAATTYQDLTTHPGDVIRWSLDHGVITETSTEAQQDMHVEIGAPNRDSSNSIIYAHGINSNINTEINDNSKATYRSTGLTNGSMNLGYANNSELVNLSLSRLTQYSKWYDCRGVYRIPAGQTVTRFAFISDDLQSPNLGNLLSNIKFNTLIGNLNAQVNSDDSITVKGYWGETDSSKKLIVKIGNTTIELNMTSVCGHNFSFVIPSSMLTGISTVDIYHVDYEPAKVTVSVSAVVKNVTKNKKYTTLQDAVNDASINDEIKILIDIEEDSCNINKSLTIDGNGKKLTGNIAMANNQNLTLKGGFEITGKITLGSNTIYNSSVLNIQDKVILPEIVCSYSNRIKLIGNLDSPSKITVNFDATTLSENTLIIQNWKEYCGNAKLNMIKSKKTQFKPLLKEGDIYLIENNHRNTWGQAIF